MIERTGIFLLKALCLWLALFVGSIAASFVVPHRSFTPRVPLDGPLGMQDAAWIVNGLFALTVAALAALARFRGVRLAGFLYVTVFGTATVMMQSESLFFKDSLQINAGAVWEGVGYAAISYLVCAGVAAVLFRPEPMDAPPAHRGLKRTYGLSTMRAGRSCRGSFLRFRAAAPVGTQPRSTANMIS
jgi:hypothetical protein